MGTPLFCFSSFAKTASAGGHDEQPSDVNSSTITGEGEASRPIACAPVPSRPAQTVPATATIITAPAAANPAFIAAFMFSVLVPLVLCLQKATAESSAPVLGAGMGGAVGFAQPVLGDVRINLRRADLGMAQHFADNAHVRAAVQKVRGE